MSCGILSSNKFSINFCNYHKKHPMQTVNYKCWSKRLKYRKYSDDYLNNDLSQSILGYKKFLIDELINAYSVIKSLYTCSKQYG